MKLSLKTSHRRHLRHGYCLLIFLWCLAAGDMVAQTPDIILHNGKILTVDADFSIAEAVAITGNTIAAVGRNEEILKSAGPGTLILDLKGRMVIPGLIDTHLHITGPGPYSDSLTPEKTHTLSVDWRGVRSKDDVLNQVKNLMDKYQFKPGDWLYFNNRLQFGIGENRKPDPTQPKILYDELNRWELDKVIPNNPAVFTLGIPDENGLLVNGKAIDILWKNDGAFITKYGRFWIDPTGKPEGHLEPPATRLLLNKYAPKLAPQDMAAGIEKTLQELNAMGVTTISTKMRLNGIEAYKMLESSKELTVRLGYGLGWDYFGSVIDLEKGLKQFQGVVGTGSDKVWVTSMAPSSFDGASTRACTNQKRIGGGFGVIDSWWPVGQCHTDAEFSGAKGKGAAIHGNYFKDWVMIGARYGLRLANDHVAGDRSVENLLGMGEELQRQFGPSAVKNWAFDHCTLVNPQDFKRAAKLGVMFSCAPKYIKDVAAEAATSYGEQVANTFILPVKSMMDAGLRVVFESDQESYKWQDLELFLTRKDRTGRVWGPQERLDRETNLKMITRWAAEYVLKQDKLGSIERGKLADLVVLDRDYLTIPVEEVGTIVPQLTIWDGKMVFVHQQFSDEYHLTPVGAIVSTYSDLKARRRGRGFVEAGSNGG